MKILFHHLAKTAGTSLIESFLARFGERVCPSRYDFELPPERIKSRDFDFYHGHFSFDKVQEFRDANPDSFVFTFVRNPLNRVISQYYNWIDKKRTEKEYQAIAERGDADPAFVKEQLHKFESDIYGKSLIEFVGSKTPAIVDVVENHQTRYLSRAATYRANRMRGLAEACDHLDGFYSFVGLTEWYDRSLERLNGLLRFPAGTLSAGIVKNTNDAEKVDGSYVIAPEAWTTILEHNTLDLSLFTFATALFRARNGIDGPISDSVVFPATGDPLARAAGGA